MEKKTDKIPLCFGVSVARNENDLQLTTGNEWPTNTLNRLYAYLAGPIAPWVQLQPEHAQQ